MKAFYQPKTVEVAETFRFHRCIQSETESVNAFCARLRGLADKFNFGTFLTRAPRDQFVSGIRSKDTQKKLLEQDRSLDECVQIANADETTNRESASLSFKKEQVEQTNYVQKPKGKSFQQKHQNTRKNKSHNTPAILVVKVITNVKTVNGEMPRVITVNGEVTSQLFVEPAM